MLGPLYSLVDSFGKNKTWIPSNSWISSTYAKSIYPGVCRVNIFAFLTVVLRKKHLKNSFSEVAGIYSTVVKGKKKYNALGSILNIRNYIHRHMSDGFSITGFICMEYGGTQTDSP